MTNRKFTDPPATANLSHQELTIEYRELYFAYKDLLARHQRLVPAAQEKAAVITSKRGRLHQQREARIAGGRQRHEETRRQVEYFLNRYWELKQEMQLRRVTADLIRRGLTSWVQNPQPVYDIDMPEGPLNDLSESTARKLFTACGKAFRECAGNKADFLALARERRR